MLLLKKVTVQVVTACCVRSRLSHAGRRFCDLAREIAIGCSDDASASLVLLYATSGVCIGCFERDCDEAKLVSGNEPEFARAVALLLHEAALINRYWSTSSKHTARIIYVVVTSG